MSGTLPSTPVPSSVEISSLSPAFVSVAHSGVRQTRTRAAHGWLIDITYPPLLTDEFSPLWAFLVAQGGQVETFECPLFGRATTRGGGTGTPSVDSITSAGSTTVPTTWANLSTTVMKAGDYLRFSGHTKIYALTADATTDGAGQVTLAIYPALRNDLAAAETISYSSLTMVVALMDSELPFTLSPGGFYDLAFRAAEVVT